MSQLIVWQGFEHEWKREVFGFRLAHRLSSLVNFIEEEGEGHVMVAGASPGVDGNYMEPQCFYRKVEAPTVRHSLRVVELEGTDCLDLSSAVPEATLELSGELVHDGEGEGACDAILAGIELLWKCDPAKQPEGWPGNSNGVWPAELDVSIDPPTRSGRRSTWRVRVRVVRGWTPMRGGVPLVAEKRLNHTMELSARIHVQILEGEDIRIERKEATVVDGEIRSEERLVAEDMPTGNPLAVAAMSHFGFTIPRHEGNGPKRHRGRYLSAVGFGVAERGQHYSVWGRVWAPITVVPSPVRHRITPVLLHFGANSNVGEQLTASGTVQSNSSEEAPFFSRYKKFDQSSIRARVPLD